MNKEIFGGLIGKKTLEALKTTGELPAYVVEGAWRRRAPGEIVHPDHIDNQEGTEFVPTRVYGPKPVVAVDNVLSFKINGCGLEKPQASIIEVFSATGQVTTDSIQPVPLFLNVLSYPHTVPETQIDEGYFPFDMKLDTGTESSQPTAKETKAWGNPRNLRPKARSHTGSRGTGRYSGK